MPHTVTTLSAAKSVHWPPRDSWRSFWKLLQVEHLHLWHITCQSWWTHRQPTQHHTYHRSMQTYSAQSPHTCGTYLVYDTMRFLWDSCGIPVRLRTCPLGAEGRIRSFWGTCKQGKRTCTQTHRSHIHTNMFPTLTAHLRTHHIWDTVEIIWDYERSHTCPLRACRAESELLRHLWAEQTQLRHLNTPAKHTCTCLALIPCLCVCHIYHNLPESPRIPWY